MGLEIEKINNNNINNMLILWNIKDFKRYISLARLPLYILNFQLKRGTLPGISAEFIQINIDQIVLPGRNIEKSTTN